MHNLCALLRYSNVNVDDNYQRFGARIPSTRTMAPGDGGNSNAAAGQKPQDTNLHFFRNFPWAIRRHQESWRCEVARIAWRIICLPRGESRTYQMARKGLQRDNWNFISFSLIFEMIFFLCFEVKNELLTVAAMTHRCTPEAVASHMELGSR